MAPYPIFFRALKTIIMPNFMLLTESEQLKHISALLIGSGEELTTMPQNTSLDPGQYLLGVLTKSGEKKANLVLFNRACRPLVSSNSGKSYLI